MNLVETKLHVVALQNHLLLFAGCTRGTTPTPPITKQPQQRGSSPSGTTTPTSHSSAAAMTPNAPAGSGSNAASEAAAQEQALLEAARRIEELQACDLKSTVSFSLFLDFVNGTADCFSSWNYKNKNFVF